MRCKFTSLPRARYSLTELREAVLKYAKATFFLMHRTSLRGAPWLAPLRPKWNMTTAA